MDQSVDQLHFNLPLISTKRPSNSNKSDHYESYTTETNRRVPFLWERTPGVPKDSETLKKHNDSGSEEFFTPRPPPGRLRTARANAHHGYSTDREVDDSRNNDDISPSTNMFSDALDKLSFSGSVRLSMPRDTGPRIARAPSFIMNRFLPAANALAASSASTASTSTKNRSRDVRKMQSGSGFLKTDGESSNVRRFSYGYEYESCAENVAAAAPVTPSRACGMMLLFPSWSMKRAVCGLKSPVRRQRSSGGTVPKVMTNIEEFTRRSTNKKGGNDSNSDDALSSRAWKSPGWGLPFLDGNMRFRGKGKRERKVSGGENGWGNKPLPRLNPPSQPWLVHALESVNRRRGY